MVSVNNYQFVAAIVFGTSATTMAIISILQKSKAILASKNGERRQSKEMCDTRYLELKEDISEIKIDVKSLLARK